MLKISLVLILMPLTLSFGESNSPQIDYDGYSTGVSSYRTTHHDLSELGFDVLEV
jgi:hypothetical protein